MKDKRFFLPAGLLAPFLIAAGGIIYAVSGQMGTLPLVLIWIGLLVLLLIFYIYFPLIREFMAKRSTRYGVNTAIMIAVFFLIVALIGIMSVRYKIRVDLTENKRYSLSPQTVKILKSLERDVEAIAFYRGDERTRQAMFDLLEEYAYYSPKFSFRFIDPDKNPAKTAKYGVTSYRTTLIRYGDKEEVVGFESENKVTNALIKVISQEVKVIYFVTGHGENSIEAAQNNGYRLIKEAIEKENHKVRPLLLISMDSVPEDAAVLVISGPKKDFLAAELEKITRYINQGGRVLFMLDPGTAPNLSLYASEFGFELGDDVIVDKLSQIYGANYLTPVVVEYNNNHLITRGFNVATFFPAARSVQIKEDSAKGSYNLAKTSANSWAVTGELDEDKLEFDPDKHQRGPINLIAVTAVTIEESTSTSGAAESLKKWGKIVVAGDSDFANNTHLKLAGNKDLFLNMINWLAEEHMLISIRKKEPGLTPVTLTASQGKLVFWISVIIVPSLIMILGIGVIVRKRQEG